MRPQILVHIRDFPELHSHKFGRNQLGNFLSSIQCWTGKGWYLGQSKYVWLLERVWEPRCGWSFQKFWRPFNIATIFDLIGFLCFFQIDNFHYPTLDFWVNSLCPISRFLKAKIFCRHFLWLYITFVGWLYLGWWPSVARRSGKKNFVLRTIQL